MWRYGLSVKYPICTALSSLALRSQEVFDGANELAGLLDFGPMPGTADLLDLRALQRFGIAFDNAARHHAIAVTPHYQGRHAHPLKAVGQARTVHERLPTQTGGFGARVLEGLERLGRHLAAIDLAELGSIDRVGDGGAQMGAEGHRDK